MANKIVEILYNNVIEYKRCVILIIHNKTGIAEILLKLIYSTSLTPVDCDKVFNLYNEHNKNNCDQIELKSCDYIM